MDSEIGRIQAGRAASVGGASVPQARGAEARPGGPRPVLEGGLSVTVGAYTAPGEVREAGLDGIEEPSRDDALGRWVRDLLDFAPPDMPDFV